ncbi:twin-arginine translocase subunit TatB [Rhizobiales bacterium]|uniref:Sec-independent protein translocase protein TatB n=1 Tax=Hongsoonwoonella zoysiae TaxID=2821844 RepID=UPI00156183BD|nr:Sec-independent protein translocase protein TatB [Hongsoonwoonella zoysiae]NRG18867.1 twin-arginine translocase subunit TatB [Hongsoonwoonella zoysiae]
MFDIGWTELLVIAMIAIIVVGPKDLPKMLRTFGQTVGKLRRMAGEFQSTFNEALREAEQQADIADMKKQVEKAGNFDPLSDLKKSIETEPKKPKPAEKVAPGDASASVGGKREEAPEKVETTAEPADAGEAAVDGRAAAGADRGVDEKKAAEGSKA